MDSRRCLVSLALLVLCSLAKAQTSALTVVGPGKTLTLDAQQWASLQKVKIKALNRHDNSTSEYSGVLLRDLLHQTGVPSGEALRGKDLAAYIRLTASDGYVAVFSLAELDTSIRDEDALVADQKDGKPLSGDHGPFQLIVPDDKRPARWIRMLTRIEVVSAK